MNSNSRQTNNITWQDIEPLILDDKYKEFFENLDTKTFELVLDEKSRPQVVESVIKMLGERDPENATQEYANEIIEVMGKVSKQIVKNQSLSDIQCLKLAIEQAKESVEKGGFPAGAIVVKDGEIVSKGISIGFILNDPTSHAETTAVREACKALSTTNLSGATLYASLQPCLMCFSGANWAEVSRIVYGCRKTNEMAKKNYYEGFTNVEDVNKNNVKKIELIFIPDFEQEMLDLVKKWEDKIL
jgi:guanine deaminase